MTAQTLSGMRCSRCTRRFRPGGGDASLWNATVKNGRIASLLCPGCQTPEENAEAVINEATTEYLGTDSQGRHYGRPRLGTGIS